MPTMRHAQATAKRRIISSPAMDRHPNTFLLVSDRADKSVDLATSLRSAGLVRILRPEDLAEDNQTYSRIVVDIDLADIVKIRQLRRKTEQEALRDLPRDFLIGVNTHHNRTQAYALGATSILTRPIPADAMLLPIRLEAASRFQDDLSGCTDELHTGISGTHDILIKIFEGTWQGQGPMFKDIVEHESDITRALHHANLHGWIDIVRNHHSHSYRHCLLVTGFAVAFGSHIGLALSDQIRLARAAIMHDVGKAFTPISILDKPGKLTDDEMAVMRRHPRDGYDYLVAQTGFPDEVLDVALHHHDLLDGTGYPDKLAGSAISDLVRMITIADIYAALVEDRPYRPAMSPDRAFGILTDMHDKLDRDLVRAFGRMTMETSSH